MFDLLALGKSNDFVSVVCDPLFRQAPAEKFTLCGPDHLPAKVDDVTLRHEFLFFEAHIWEYLTKQHDLFLEPFSVTGTARLRRIRNESWSSDIINDLGIARVEGFQHASNISFVRLSNGFAVWAFRSDRCRSSVSIVSSHGYSSEVKEWASSISKPNPVN